MSSIQRQSIKLFGAAIGGSALVAFGAVNVIAHQPSGQLNATGATVGAVPAPTTTTNSPVFGVGAVVSATPTMTGKAPYWPGQSPNHTPQ
jgi:hypothetical protein